MIGCVWWLRTDRKFEEGTTGVDERMRGLNMLSGSAEICSVSMGAVMSAVDPSNEGGIEECRDMDEEVDMLLRLSEDMREDRESVVDERELREGVGGDEGSERS